MPFAEFKVFKRWNLHSGIGFSYMNTLYDREKEIEDIRAFVTGLKEFLLNPIPDGHPLEQEMFFKSAKTAMMLLDWAEERSEDQITKKYKMKTKKYKPIIPRTAESINR